MANQQKNSPTQAWADFAATGRVEDYLRYRAAENRADAVTGISGGTHANPGPGAAQRRLKGKRPPYHGPY